MKWICVLCAALMLSPTLMAQAKKPCDDARAAQFDFWVGDWELEWDGPDGKVNKATNKIDKFLGQCIVRENFKAGNYEGFSTSAFDPAKGVWRQTWVDNQGGYIALTGAWKNDMMELRTEKSKDKDGEFIMRMIFTEIKKDSLVWRWQRSGDNGKSWQDKWVLRYKRK